MSDAMTGMKEALYGCGCGIFLIGIAIGFGIVMVLAVLSRLLPP